MKICEKCQKENRDQARYCRFCGEEFAVDEPYAGNEAPDSDETPKDSFEYMLVGMETPRKEISDLITTIKAVIKKRGKNAFNNINSNILITGPTGTGKSELAKAIMMQFMSDELASEDDFGAYTPLNIDDLNFQENEEMDLVWIDDAHKCLPYNKEDNLSGTPLDYVFVNVNSILRDANRHVTLIMSGNQELQDYIDRRPELKNLFAVNIRLPEYTPTEVAEICRFILKKTHGMTMTPEAREKLGRVINYERRNSDNFGNAHLASAKANELMLKASRNGHGDTIEAADVTGKEYTPKTLDEVMKEFDRYVGVDEIKETMTGIVNSIRSFEKLHPDRKYELKDHYLFLGNPGTGKTTMARVFADALSAMGILPSGQLVEVAPKDLKGQYMGHTGPKVDSVFDRAMGGVLFIDAVSYTHDRAQETPERRVWRVVVEGKK
ncbi:MAG: AAA family ATPase, partial [Muribaculaceae bacterium]|nr:AAA family ATPase [Muribaculaceae bacterium]